jgi:RNA polymerase sigma factor (TIGR02999 family)
MATLEPKPGGSDDSITALLLELSEGNRDAEARLLPQVYSELRRLAARYMRRERVNHTLQPTALVHEAYLRLVQQPHLPLQSRVQFFAAASNLMRHILVDHARARQAGKRGGIQHQVELEDDLLAASEQSIDVLALNEAIERLAALDPRQGRIVELHFFGGLTFEEMASVLQCSERTVKSDWSLARVWLKRELSKQG